MIGSQQIDPRRGNQQRQRSGMRMRQLLQKAAAGRAGRGMGGPGRNAGRSFLGRTHQTQAYSVDPSLEARMGRGHDPAAGPNYRSSVPGAPVERFAPPAPPPEQPGPPAPPPGRGTPPPGMPEGGYNQAPPGGPPDYQDPLPDMGLVPLPEPQGGPSMPTEGLIPLGGGIYMDPETGLIHGA